MHNVLIMSNTAGFIQGRGIPLNFLKVPPNYTEGVGGYFYLDKEEKILKFI